MKKIALFITAIAVSLSIGGKALADTTAATLADKASITPDHTILYAIHKAFDNLRINLAFSDEKKAKVLADVAEERLGESEVMANKGMTDLSNQTLNEYNDKMTEAQDKVEDAIDKASNDTTSNTTSSSISTPTDITAINAKLDELKKLETTIANEQMYSIEVLENIENKVSGNAKDTIAQVIEMQTRKNEAIAAVAKERQTLLQDKTAVKEAEKSLDQAKKAGNDQAIKTAEDTLQQAEQALTTENEKFAQVVAAKKEAMKGGVGQLKKLAKKDLKGQTDNTSSSSNNTTSGTSTATTGTTPATSSDTSSTNNTATTGTDANTTNTTGTANTSTQSTVSNNAAVTNSTKTNTTVKENDDQGDENDQGDNAKENRGHEKKAKKENKGQEMKAERENNSDN